MFNFFKKKKEEGAEEDAQENLEEKSQEAEENAKKDVPALKVGESNNVKGDLIKIGTEIDRLKAGQEAFKEVRKSFSDMITHINEQIGEVRSMILERDRTIQTLELKAVKAGDLVASIQPEKFLTEIQKQEVKITALKANIESNEAIMDRIMNELKEIRKKVEFFRGVEEIVKLAEEVKSELIEIKKVEGKINIQTDKIETIYSEMRKRVKDLDAFNSTVQEMKVQIDQQMKDIDFVKVKLQSSADKGEVDKIMSKITETNKMLTELKKKSTLSRDLEELQTIVEGIK